MATRSRLGRDPLQTAPKPPARKNAPSPGEPADGKAAAPASRSRKKPAETGRKAAVAIAQDRSRTAPEAAPDALQPDRPNQETSAGTETLPMASVPAAPAWAEPVDAPAPLDDAIARESASIPSTKSRQDRDARLVDKPGSPAEPSGLASLASPLNGEDAEPGEPAANAGDDATPQVPPQAAPTQPKHQTSLQAAPAAAQEPASRLESTASSDGPVAVDHQGQAGPSLDADAHPVAVFLRGVLEGLLPEGEAALRVEVDASTTALPVEKLFYFSHALQRIAMPLENAASASRRPGPAAGPLPALTVRLRPIGRGRHSLTLFDNGCFFTSRLPGLTLGMEALTPLTAFVAKRQGSVVLAQGRVTAFEIIG